MEIAGVLGAGRSRLLWITSLHIICLETWEVSGMFPS